MLEISFLIKFFYVGSIKFGFFRLVGSSGSAYRIFAGFDPTTEGNEIIYYKEKFLKKDE